MSIKFMNNSIKIGKGKSFADLVKEKVEKQAGCEVEAKTIEAEEAEEADSSGQLEVEPLHQEGESEEPSAVTDENKKTETGKKETGKKEAGKKGKSDSDENKENKENKEEKGDSDADEETLEETEEEGKEEKDCRTAETKPRFQKIAKLTEESKTLLRAEWESVFPKDYVAAMLAEY